MKDMRQAGQQDVHIQHTMHQLRQRSGRANYASCRVSTTSGPRMLRQSRGLELLLVSTLSFHCSVPPSQQHTCLTSRTPCHSPLLPQDVSQRCILRQALLLSALFLSLDVRRSDYACFWKPSLHILPTQPSLVIPRRCRNSAAPYHLSKVSAQAPP